MKVMLITIILIFLVLIMISACCMCSGRPNDPEEDAAQLRYVEEWSATRKARQKNRRFHHDRNS